MDGKRFDDLIRQFCTTRLTRLGALRGLAAGAAAALTGATLASDEADAKKGGKGRHKGSKGQAKSVDRVGTEAKGGSARKGKGKGKGKGQRGRGGQGRLSAQQVSETRCTCEGTLSPKGCPDPGDNPKYTCKLCPGITQGSVQVGCDGNTPFCFCNANCTVNGVHYEANERVEACTPFTCPDPSQVSCDDEDACTNDTCDRNTGFCKHTPISCDDDNACTNDSCDPDTGCVHTKVNCDDDNACTEDTCDPATGCVHTPISCDDGLACTRDTCDPAIGCVHTPVVCRPQNRCETNCICTEPDGLCKCDPVVCDDDLACTKDRCDPVLGCQHEKVVCEPPNACKTNCICTEPDGLCVCKDVNCDDGLVCTIDRCDPVLGCQHRKVVCESNNVCKTNCRCEEPTGCVCDGIGCTLTQGYWKNHTEDWPIGPGVPKPGDAFFKSGKTYLGAMQTSSSVGNGYYALAQQYIAAVLNRASGACAPDAVAKAIADAKALFAAEPDDTFSKTLKTKVVALIKILTDYNEGATGPGHCDS